LQEAPETVRKQFEDFEEIVNNQVFSLLDEIEDRISALGITAIGEDGRRAAVVDLQVFPAGKRVSFRLAAETVLGATH
jgi:hypothetical protein